LRHFSEAGGGVKTERPTPTRSRHGAFARGHPILQIDSVVWRPLSHFSRTTRSLSFNCISRAELSNCDVEASSASSARSPRAMRVEVGSGIPDGEWLCCVRR
jgi:hypothetical protein